MGILPILPPFGQRAAPDTGYFTFVTLLPEYPPDHINTDSGAALLNITNGKVTRKPIDSIDNHRRLCPSPSRHQTCPVFELLKSSQNYDAQEIFQPSGS